MEKHFLKRKKEHINKHWLEIVKKYQIEDNIVITHDKISNKNNVLIYTTKNEKIRPFRGRIDYRRDFLPEYANKLYYTEIDEVSIMVMEAIKRTNGNTIKTN